MSGLAVLGSRIDRRRSGRLAELAVRRACQPVPVLDVSHRRRTTIRDVIPDVGYAVQWSQRVGATCAVLHVGVDDVGTDLTPTEWVKLVHSLCITLSGQHDAVVVAFPDVPDRWGTTSQRRWLRRTGKALWSNPPPGPVRLLRVPVAAAGARLDAALEAILDACR